MAEEYMTVGEAREYLGISRGKMAKLLKEGKLQAIEDPLDSRAKLIKKEDVDKLKLRDKK